MAALVLGITLMAQETPDTGAYTRPAESDIIIEDIDTQENAAVQDRPDALPGIGFGDFARMILVLGLVIGLIYGFFWLLKRFSGAKAEGEDAINLLATRPLKGDVALHLVEVGTHIYMVGSSSSAVNLIAELDDKESVDEIRLLSSRTARPASGGFAAMIRSRFASSGSKSGADSDNDPAEFVRRQRERLKDL